MLDSQTASAWVMPLRSGPGCQQDWPGPFWLVLTNQRPSAAFNATNGGTHHSHHQWIALLPPTRQP